MSNATAGSDDRRSLFSHDVVAYASGRPGYPDRVYELLRDRCGLGPGTRVIEVGPGTGQATRTLLEAHASVVAIELSDEFATYLSTSFAEEQFTVEVGAFESVEPVVDSADLVVSATAFHWVPTMEGLRRSAQWLRPGGHLALWWNVFGDPNRPDPFDEALVAVLRRVVPSVLDAPGVGGVVAGSLPYGLDAQQRIADMRLEGRFVEIHHETIAWTCRHRASELRALFGSFSPWLALPADERSIALDALEQLVNDEFDGFVDRPYLTPVYLARKL